MIVDRLAVRDGIAQRLSDSVETALKLADGLVEINVINGETQLYSEHFACSDCGISLPEIEPRLFSFNNPYGACPECTGLGMNMELDKELIIPDGAKNLCGRCNCSTQHEYGSLSYETAGSGSEGLWI